MPRPQARLHRGDGRSVRRERSFGLIDAIDLDLIRAQVGYKQEAIVRRKHNRMRVRSRLASRVYAPTAELIEAGPFTDTSIHFKGKRGDISTSVVGHKERLAGFVYDQ